MLEILNLMVDQGLGNIREIAYQVRLGVRHNGIKVEGRTFQGTAKCMQVRTVHKENVYLFHLRLLNQSFNNTCPIKVPDLITAASVWLFTVSSFYV